jgi:hypothetical protein
VAQVSLTRLTSHSNAFPIAVNPLQNECSCHLFDGNVGELHVVLSCKYMGNSSDKKGDFQNNPGPKELKIQP